MKKTAAATGIMLEFLFLTLLVGVSQSMIVGDEEENVFTYMEAGEHSRAKRALNTCPFSNTLCHAMGGRCADYGSPAGHCENVHILPNLCGSQCKCRCCVDCQWKEATSKCATEGVGGTCRRRHECESTEYEDVMTPCFAKTCMCCRTCPATTSCTSGDNTGTCVTDVLHYIQKGIHYVDENSSCGKAGCTCVRQCKKGNICTRANGYCIQKDFWCKPGYFKLQCGCNDKGKSCHCCIPDDEKVPDFQKECQPSSQ